MQFLAPERSRTPTTYFSPQSGVGLALASRRATDPTAHQRVGILGLGVGTLAAYGRPGDDLRFYEINPAVIQTASAQFSFLRDSAAKISVVTGDGRLMLAREEPENFDVLILDAFSGDSIPVHLLTRQAMELYFRHLRPGGILAINVTNKYLDLPAVVLALAGDVHKRVLLISNQADRSNAIYQADWAILSDQSDALAELQRFSHPAQIHRSVRPWTDDYSNLFQILK
jgi:spermidine synthase